MGTNFDNTNLFSNSSGGGSLSPEDQEAIAQIPNKQNSITKVNNQAEMLALTNAVVGDFITRADDNSLYRLNALPSSILSNWQIIGKDVPPIGETVEDVITNNESITSKADGLYAFADVPNGGFPAGVARGDIAEKTGSSWVVVYTFATAPASIFVKSDGKVYNKKIDNNNNPTWFVLPEPTFYEVGSGKEYATLQSAVDAYDVSGKPLGVINVFDQTIDENVTINANIENLVIKGFGGTGRANTQISKITILGHRVTLNTLQINELEINSAGTITENGKPNIGRGKHIFDKVSFANATTAFTVTAVNNFLSFYDCDFNSKIISIADHTGLPTSITFNNCQNGILNLGSNRFCIKSYSPSVYTGTVTGTIIDLDSATPIAYSALRKFTASGVEVPVSVGAMVINDDVGGNLANLKCTTAYTIAPALGAGTPINLTKYEGQTTATNLSITNKNAITLDIASDTGSDATIPEATTTEAGLLIATDKVKLNNTSGTNTGDETQSTILTKIGYTPENIANKVADFTSPNNTTYPTTQAVKTEIDTKQDKIYDFLDTETNILLIDPAVNNGKTAKATDTLKQYISDGITWVEVVNNSGGGSGVPVGSTVAYMSNTIPDGWLLCDGSTFNATIYPDLQAFLGGTTLPDLRGVFLRGAGVTTANGMINGTNYNATTVGAFQGDLFKSHNHNHIGSYIGNSNGLWHPNNSASVATGFDNPTNYNGAIQFAGGTETRPKNIGVNYIIKAI